MTDPWITEPGVYDLTAEQYHRDPVVGGSLSNSGAKKLMPPSCPALFREWCDGGSEEKRAFDFGRAAHRRVLGVGDDVVVIPGSGQNDAWLSKAAKEAVEEARAAGLTPIKPAEEQTIEEMAAALRRHPMAAALLDPDSGRPEQTLVWRDRETGVMCRALVDFLRHPVTGQRLIVPDYKSAERVDPISIGKALYDFGYYGQAAWYGDGAEQLGLSDGPPAFVLIFQMKQPPYLVVVGQVDDDAIALGRDRNRAARELYRQCLERDQWPGYADDHVIPISLPAYATYQIDDAIQRAEQTFEGATQ